jgi:hypothetical protein
MAKSKATGGPALGQAAKKEWGSFIEQYDPALQDQLKNLNSTELITDARADATNVSQRTLEANQRMMQRRGISLARPVAMAQERRAKLDQGLISTNAANQARVAQTDQNDATALSLANTAGAVNNLGFANLSAAAEMQNTRVTNNANAKAADKASRDAKIGTAVGATALIAAAFIAG